MLPPVRVAALVMGIACSVSRRAALPAAPPSAGARSTFFPSPVREPIATRPAQGGTARLSARYEGAHDLRLQHCPFTLSEMNRVNDFARLGARGGSAASRIAPGAHHTRSGREETCSRPAEGGAAGRAAGRDNGCRAMPMPAVRLATGAASRRSCDDHGFGEVSRPIHRRATTRHMSSPPADRESTQRLSRARAEQGRLVSWHQLSV